MPAALRYALHQHVALGEQRHHQQLDGKILADDDLLNLALNDLRSRRGTIFGLMCPPPPMSSMHAVGDLPRCLVFHSVRCPDD